MLRINLHRILTTGLIVIAMAEAANAKPATSNMESSREYLDDLGYLTFDIGGFLDAQYNYTQIGRDHEFAIDLAELQISTDYLEAAQMNLDLRILGRDRTSNTTTETVTLPSGTQVQVPSENASIDESSNFDLSLGQAMIDVALTDLVEFLPGAIDRISLSFGRHDSFMGLESNDSTAISTVSHGYVHNLATPFYMTGVGLHFETALINVHAYYINGAEINRETNDAKMWGGKFELTPFENFSFSAAGLWGNDDPATADTTLNTAQGSLASGSAIPTMVPSGELTSRYNFILKYNFKNTYIPVIEGLDLQAEYLMGRQSWEDTYANVPELVYHHDQQGSFDGATAIAKYNLGAIVGELNTVSAGIRYAFLDDEDGFLTGTVQRLDQYTIFVGWNVTNNLEVRAEFRTDETDKNASGHTDAFGRPQIPGLVAAKAGTGLNIGPNDNGADRGKSTRTSLGFVFSF
ncbi:MAG: porin [Planctomycetes bacterium]|nr:porin [Planctomycetota bacterium]